MVTVCPSQFATRRTLFHVLVGCGLLLLKVSRLKLPVIWLLVSMWLNTLTKTQICTLQLKVYALSLHDALPIWCDPQKRSAIRRGGRNSRCDRAGPAPRPCSVEAGSTHPRRVDQTRTIPEF